MLKVVFMDPEGFGCSIESSVSDESDMEASPILCFDWNVACDPLSFEIG